MDVLNFIGKLKELAGPFCGMVLVHNGIVKAKNRSGQRVHKIKVEVDKGRLQEIMEAVRSMPGVLAAQCEIREGELEVGEDIMLLGIAADIRENCFGAMTYALERIKGEVTRKVEY